MDTFSQFLEQVSNIHKIADDANIDIDGISLQQLKMGMKVEREHDGRMGKDVKVVGSDAEILKVAVAHLREDPKYYTKLKKIEDN